MEALVAIVVVVLFYFLWSALRPRQSANFPPGPRLWFPIFGHLPWLGKKAHQTLLEWKEIYGPVVGLWFGKHRAIAISDAALIREALNSGLFDSRPPIGIYIDFGGKGRQGMVASEGAPCLEQKRFVTRQMKDYGFGSTASEAKVQDVFLQVLERFEVGADKPLLIEADTFAFPMLRILWNFLMSEQRETSDEGLARILERVFSLFRDSSGTVGLSMFMPWVYKIVTYFQGESSPSGLFRDIQHFVKERVQIHNESRQDPPRDFVDAYMNKVSRTQDLNSSFHPSHDSIVYSISDLIMGSSETVSNTLSWLLLYMVTWPEIQTKLQEELDAVVGHERNPSLTDKPKLPYTFALIYEVLRFSSITPLAALHSATEDAHFRGFRIPKGTIVVINTYAAHFDKDIWTDPQNFRPARFLDDSGTVVKCQERLLVFSAGKRSCPGETIAMDELFIFVTHFFQRFEARVVGELPGLDGPFGITVTTYPFKITLEKRGEKK